MSDAALQRTVRRIGALVVVALWLPTSTLIQYVRYDGLDVQLQLLGTTGLFLGALGYLCLSFLLSAVGSYEAGVEGAPDGE
ncbi:hypothetical protein [Halobacterium rubrum]|uniref:hypothetical protein n=1 Tax=Halobacterium TaxID=2239 RepID=UPI001F2ABBC4|nr:MULTISPECIES: hypothetical protein [Halobacterium]MDH5019910.1 hypothetical protein [Halobacterium rubrum]